MAGNRGIRQDSTSEARIRTRISQLESRWTTIPTFQPPTHRHLADSCAAPTPRSPRGTPCVILDRQRCSRASHQVHRARTRSYTQTRNAQQVNQPAHNASKPRASGEMALGGRPRPIHRWCQYRCHCVLFYGAFRCAIPRGWRLLEAAWILAISRSRAKMRGAAVSSGRL